MEILLEASNGLNKQSAGAQPKRSNPKKAPKSPAKKRGRPLKTQPVIELSDNDESEEDLARADPHDQPSIDIASFRAQPAEQFNNLGFAAADFLAGLKNSRSIGSFLLACGLTEDDESVEQVE